MASESYPPGQKIGGNPGAARVTRVVAVHALTAARALDKPVVLNFASGTNPGGGWRAGARGQEEDLCRSSDLAAHIEGHEMYRHHRQGSALYTGWMLYTPDVEVRRDGAWPCAFITCAAPNAGAARQQGHSDEEIADALRARVRRVVALASEHHRNAVFGAWGCGVFRNDPVLVADAFADALGRYDFDEVVFAIRDTGPGGQHLLDTFRARLR